MTNFYGLIPARGGSKGIPRKNLFEIDGTPLIDYTINCASELDIFKDIFLSTDDEDIANRARGSRVKVPDLRPSTLAQDDTLTIDVAQHAIKNWIAGFGVDDYLVLLQPTSPLRRPQHVLDACDLITDCREQNLSLVSVCDVGAHHPNRMKVIQSDGKLKNFSGELLEDMRPRQQLPPVYIRNGAIYINKIMDILENDRMLTPICLPYIMSINESINIDSLDDIHLLDKRLRAQA